MYKNIFITLNVSFENNQHSKYWKEDFYGLSNEVSNILELSFSGGALNPEVKKYGIGDDIPSELLPFYSYHKTENKITSREAKANDIFERQEDVEAARGTGELHPDIDLPFVKLNNLPVTVPVCRELMKILYYGKTNAWDLKLEKLDQSDKDIVNDLRNKFIIGQNDTGTSLAAGRGVTGAPIEWKSYKNDYHQAVVNIGNVINGIEEKIFNTSDNTIAELTMTPFNFYKTGEISSNMTYKKTMASGIVPGALDEELDFSSSD